MEVDEKISMSSNSSMQSCHTTVSAHSNNSNSNSSSSSSSINAADKDQPVAPVAPAAQAERSNSAQPPSESGKRSHGGSQDRARASRDDAERGWSSGPPRLTGGGSGAAAAATERLLSPGGALRVLVAEDNLVNQKVLLKVLQRVTPESKVFVANNGQEALQVGAAIPLQDICSCLSSRTETISTYSVQ